MRKRRFMVNMSLVIILIIVLGGCGAKSDKNFMELEQSTEVAYDRETTGAESMEMPEAPAEAAGEMQYTSDDSINNASAITIENSAALTSQDKIIRTFFLDVETQEFDTLITRLDSELDRLAGYVESSKISGRSIYDREGARRASITARIPRDKVDEFVNTVGERANVIDKQESSENVTLKYADIESRKKSLQIEQERLFALLEKADSLDSIVILESRLSEIRYELQNYESTLRTYDNKVEYSTVSLSIQEVEKLTAKVEIKQTVGTRIKNGFQDTMYDISDGLQNFIVWFVVNLPYLLIWSAIIAAVVIIIRRIVWKKAGEEKPKKSQTPPTPPNS